MSMMVMGAIDQAIEELTPLVGRQGACQAMGAPRASHYPNVSQWDEHRIAIEPGRTPIPKIPVPMSVLPRATPILRGTRQSRVRGARRNNST